MRTAPAVVHPFLFLLLASCSSGGGDPVDAEATVMPGEAFEVVEGDLAGVRVEIPLAASAEPVHVTVAKALAEAVPGFRYAGRALTLGPGRPFAAPLAVTIPFHAAASSGNELVVLQRCAGGGIVEIAPASIDPVAGLLTFHPRELGTCWAAERLFLGVGTEEFLPVQDGDSWVFENGLSMATTMALGEPNVPFAYRLRLQGQQDERTFYIDRHWSGTTELLGTTASTGAGWQRLHERRRLLPGRVTLDRTVVDDFVADVYEPYGATVPTAAAVVSSTLVAEQPTRISTPVGDYSDLLQVRFTWSDVRTDGSLVATQEVVVTFARYVGPVAVEAFGQRGALVGGIVGGVPIGQ
jgi:hypothetical protein